MWPIDVKSDRELFWIQELFWFVMVNSRCDYFGKEDWWYNTVQMIEDSEETEEA